MFCEKNKEIFPYIVWALVLGYYLAYALNSAFQRDGAHFLFMSNQICDGYSPYWASFETKTPLVEYFWCGFHRSVNLFFDSTIWQSARVFESLYIFATTALFYRFLRDNKVDLSISTVFSTLLLVFLADPRITDNGFNISIYQPLLCFSVLLMAHKILSEKNIVILKAIGLGILLFCSWFVKQTSVFDISAALLFIFLISKNSIRERLRRASFAILPFFLIILGFVAYLQNTNTLQYYLLGTFNFHLKRVDLGVDFVSDGIKKLWGAFSFPENYPAYLFVLFCLLVFFLIMLPIKRPQEKHNIIILLLWAFGCIVSALVPLTFFKHYWINLAFPLFAVCALMLTGFSKIIRMTVSFGLALVTSAFIFKSHQFISKNSLEKSAQYRISLEIDKYISSADTIFMWGGLPHYYVLKYKVSKIPQNMWWSFIQDSKEKNALKVGDYLRKYRPNKIIQMYERYSLNQSLYPFFLDEKLILELSGCEYRLMVNIENISGRYGVPVSIWELSKCSF